MKQIEIDNLANNGILFEINRHVLHPLGFNIKTIKRPMYDDEVEIIIEDYSNKIIIYGGLIYDNTAIKKGTNAIIKYLSKPEVKRLLSNRYKRFKGIRQPLWTDSNFHKENKKNSKNEKCKKIRKKKK